MYKIEYIEYKIISLSKKYKSPYRKNGDPNKIYHTDVPKL
jgi:hypothetical protein